MSTVIFLIIALGAVRYSTAQSEWSLANLAKAYKITALAVSSSSSDFNDNNDIKMIYTGDQFMPIASKDRSMFGYLISEACTKYKIASEDRSSAKAFQNYFYYADVSRLFGTYWLDENTSTELNKDFKPISLYKPVDATVKLSPNQEIQQLTFLPSNLTVEAVYVDAKIFTHSFLEGTDTSFLMIEHTEASAADTAVATTANGTEIKLKIVTDDKMCSSYMKIADESKKIYYLLKPTASTVPKVFA